MNESLKFRLVQRELELMSHFALGIVEELELAEREEVDAEARLVLVRALISAALKLSRLLWPFGRRAGDDLNVEEAGSIRRELDITDRHPLAPAQVIPLAAALSLRHDELTRGLDESGWVFTVDGVTRDLREVAAAIHRIHEEIARHP